MPGGAMGRLRDQEEWFCGHDLTAQVATSRNRHDRIVPLTPGALATRAAPGSWQPLRELLSVSIRPWEGLSVVGSLNTSKMAD